MGNLIDTDGLDQYTDEITTFTSGDSSSPSSFTTIPVVASKEKPSSLFQKLSQAIANIRWLYNNKRGSGAFNAQNDTVTFTTADASSDSSATSWTSVSQLTSGNTFSTLMNRISAMMKNTRYLYKLQTYSDTNVVTSLTSQNSYLTLDNVGGVICGRIKIITGRVKVKNYLSDGSGVYDEFNVQYSFVPNTSSGSSSVPLGCGFSYKPAIIGDGANAAFILAVGSIHSMSFRIQIKTLGTTIPAGALAISFSLIYI